MKKLCSVLLIYSMLLSACGNSSQPEQQTKEDTKQEQTKQEQTKQEETKSEEASTEAPTGDGIVSEEQIQKSWVYFDEILGSRKYDMSYEDIKDYYGIDGYLTGQEYVENMEANYRYYNWISEEDENHFIHINFKEKEDGIYYVSSLNTSGFTGQEAKDKYLDQVKQEAKEEAVKEADQVGYEDITVKVCPFSDSDNPLDIKVTIPKKNWSYKESNGTVKIVNNKDPNQTFDGFIQIAMEETSDKLTKDGFEDVQNIESKTINKMEMQGRTYTYIGMEWTEYIVELEDGRGFSIAIAKYDADPGTLVDKIISSISF